LKVGNFNLLTCQPTQEQPSTFSGIFQRRDEQDYAITLTAPPSHTNQIWTLITLDPRVNEQLQTCTDQQRLTLWGYLNPSGSWLVVEKIEVP
jgi:hypothetical protein